MGSMNTSRQWITKHAVHKYYQKYNARNPSLRGSDVSDSLAVQVHLEIIVRHLLLLRGELALHGLDPGRSSHVSSRIRTMTPVCFCALLRSPNLLVGSSLGQVSPAKYSKEWC